ncbi:hypothetical protein PVL29_002570 [Vitis rotundifolia]|uniref:Uncharacterized protein n=1 Tax=Vitis rotundifolia TaxID=103349 RepID=A0AA39AJW7_VITRO|nr:hypothetical protein PVL29_002570 [Vitis rotundifolia]
MCRCEVHLVKYLVLPPSQLKKTFSGGAHGHFGKLQRKGEVLLCKKSNTSSWFCKRTRRLSKHWVRKSVKACAELTELWTSLGVHGHVLEYGLESIAAGSGDEHDEVEHSETDVNHSRSLHSGGSKTMPFYLYVICTVSVT